MTGLRDCLWFSGPVSPKISPDRAALCHKRRETTITVPLPLQVWRGRNPKGPSTVTDDYARRKVQVIKEFLETQFPAPYTVETVLPRRDPLADTKYKIILNNVVERILLVCPALVMDSFPTPDLLKELLVSRRVIDKVNASTDSRICHDDLGTDDQNYQKPIRSVRGL